MRGSDARPGIRGAAFLVALAAAIALSQIAVGFSQGPNNRNVSIDTRVNVTGSGPEIIAIRIDNPITLVAGSVRVVACNISVRDYDGFNDLITVNATFFRANHTLGEADDNNTHYTNSSCSAILGQQSGAYANYTCTFPLGYYAVNGTWNCTAAVNDTINLQGRGSNITNISALLALNVTPLIDYGDVAMGTVSANQTANVTNLGNTQINVTVRGYGATINDGFSFVCEQGNIPVGRQKFSSNSTATYAEKQNLTSAYTTVTGLAIRKAYNSTSALNTTYWQLFLDPNENVFGLCNGTIIFQAESST